MHDDLALCWRVEEACALAWPALNIQNFGGYAFRHTAFNRSRRANSVNPIRDNPLPARIVGAAAQRFFTHHQMKPTFRVLEIATSMTGWLNANGYDAPESETITLLAPELSGLKADSRVQISPGVTPAWLEAWVGFQNEGTQERDVFAKMLDRIFHPCFFGLIEIDQQVAAIAYAVQIDQLVIIEAVGTHAGHRRKGLARAMVETLLHHAARQGAERAALQVVAENQAARNLYAKIGFSTELYRYHYRTKK